MKIVFNIVYKNIPLCIHAPDLNAHGVAFAHCERYLYIGAQGMATTYSFNFPDCDSKLSEF